VEYTLVAVTPLVAFIVSRAGKIIKMDPVLWKRTVCCKIVY